MISHKQVGTRFGYGRFRPASQAAEKVLDVKAQVTIERNGFLYYRSLVRNGEVVVQAKKVNSSRAEQIIVELTEGDVPAYCNFSQSQPVNWAWSVEVDYS